MGDEFSAQNFYLAIYDVTSALHWLRSTFLYVRIGKNPAYYSLSNTDVSPDARLERICLDAIEDLTKHGIIHREADSISSTSEPRSMTAPAGLLTYTCRQLSEMYVARSRFATVASLTHYRQMMARCYLTKNTFVSLKEVPEKSNMRALLETICAASEFKEMRFRAGEKPIFNKINTVSPVLERHVAGPDTGGFQPRT